MTEPAKSTELNSGADSSADPPATQSRRLGLRVAVSCWALLQARGRSLYAQALELSATGVVLRLVGVRHAVRFRGEQRFGLDLFVPGSALPVHATVRPVRAIGALEAFELVDVSPVDRLTLAEYLDSLRTPAALTGRDRPSDPVALAPLA